MTGAIRLLVGVAWPLMVLLHWLKDRDRSVQLAAGNAIEIGFLLLASVYSFGILYRGRIAFMDLFLLLAIFGAYLWRVRGQQKTDDPNEEEEAGPAAALKELSVRAQWATMGGLVAVACAIILAPAERFAEGLVGTGRARPR